MADECKELQDEEREALASIYEGDELFKQTNPTTFQYKYGEDNDNKAFLVEISWGEEYPHQPPTINMDTFFNRHLVQPVKQKLTEALNEEAQQWLGCGMTYTLFEFIKDKIPELVSEQPDQPMIATELSPKVDALKIADTGDGTASKSAKKEQLTKSQKRRQWERTDHKGERARGWNWVDIVKHLSQTGSKDEHFSSDANVVS